MSTVNGPAPELDLLRALRIPGSPPADAAAALADGARADARARLLARAAASAGQGGPAHVRMPARRRLPSRLGIGGAAVAALAVVAVGLGVGTGADQSDGPASHAQGLVNSVVGVPSASAAATLQSAADAAVGQPTIAFTPATRWVVRAQGAELWLNNGPTHINGKLIPVKNPYAAILLSSGETRTSYDGHVRADRDPIGGPRFTTKASAAAYRAEGSPKLASAEQDYPIIYPGNGKPKPFVAGSKALSYADILALPTDTQALARWVAEATPAPPNGSQDAVDFGRIQVITDLMLRAPLPPDLRGALWRVAAQLPSLKLLGATRDPIGRTGVGVTITAGDERENIVFSPQTGMVMSAWIYKRSAVTTCDGDLDYCSPAKQAAGDHGKPWTVLAVPGAAERGTTVLSASVQPGE